MFSMDRSFFGLLVFMSKEIYKVSFCFSEKGQFFSPDLIIAAGVFIFSMVLFLNSSNAVFNEVNVVNSNKEIDFVANSALDSLVFSSGSPYDWEHSSLADINSFGLADSINVLDESKVLSLINYLNSADYVSVKQSLGFGPYDLQLRLLSSGSVITYSGTVLSSGQVVSNYKTKKIYSRIVSFNDSEAVLEAALSVAE
jgi:hypothetical protein